ncbi:MAG: aldo/keto reductase [Bryobacteraceae bacterium]|jgi:predicted aldo/keto reductase-like oxidoreductase
MNPTSRRSFLGTSLALPALASVPSETGSPAQAPAAQGRAPQSAPKFTYGTLGKTGMRVTRLAFGCMVTSDQSVVERAADTGINYFDTARVYQGGNNERMLGAALKNYRDKVYISTKTGAKDRKTALSDLDASLKELQTDHVDVWNLHSRSTPDAVPDDVLEAQRIAKRDGKIRFAGVSFHSGHAEMIPFLLKLNHFDVFVMSYNYTMDPSIEPLLVTARKANVGLVAMKVMAGGAKPSSFYKVDPDKLSKLTREGAPLAALKWAMKNPNIDTTIPSIVDNEQLDENLTAMSAPFSAADGKLLARRLEEIKPLYCRMCGHCEGQCSQGLPVADVLRFLMYAEGYGQFAMAREHFKTLPAEVAGVRCASCSNCTVKCPNGVQVSARLYKAQQLFA